MSVLLIYLLMPKARCLFLIWFCYVGRSKGPWYDMRCGPLSYRPYASNPLRFEFRTSKLGFKPK